MYRRHDFLNPALDEPPKFAFSGNCHFQEIMIHSFTLVELLPFVLFCWLLPQTIVRD
jgi:hypothetical protein